VPSSQEDFREIHEVQVSEVSASFETASSVVTKAVRALEQRAAEGGPTMPVNGVCGVSDVLLSRSSPCVHVFGYTDRYRIYQVDLSTGETRVAADAAPKIMGLLKIKNHLYFANFSLRRLGRFNTKTGMLEAVLPNSLRIKHFIDRCVDCMSGAIKNNSSHIYFIENRPRNDWTLARFNLSTDVFESIELTTGLYLESIDVVDNYIYTLDWFGIVACIGADAKSHAVELKKVAFLSSESKSEYQRCIGDRHESPKRPPPRTAFNRLAVCGNYLVVLSTAGLMLLDRMSLKILDDTSTHPSNSDQPKKMLDHTFLKPIMTTKKGPTFILTLGTDQVSSKATLNLHNIHNSRLTAMNDIGAVGIDTVYDVKQPKPNLLLVFGRCNSEDLSIQRTAATLVRMKLSFV